MWKLFGEVLHFVQYDNVSTLQGEGQWRLRAIAPLTPPSILCSIPVILNVVKEYIYS